MIRRAIGTTLVGFCALTGPLSSGVFAASTGATLSLSATSARPGAVFTVSPTSGQGCPADDGVQTVQLTFTDHAGVQHAVGTAETADDGSWADARALLPVAGLDADGNWSAPGVAAGAGKVSAACFIGDDAGDDSDDSGDDAGDDSDDDFGDESADDSTDADDSADADGEDDGDDGSEDPGEDTGDPDDDGTDPDDEAADEPTRTYAGIAFTVAGSARKLSLSAGMITPGGSVTVTPAEGCAVAGESTVEVAVISLSGTESDDPDGEEDGGDGESGDDPGTNGSALPTTFVTTSATGTWVPVTLTLPAGTETGDYAVTADCTTAGLVTSSYDAAPLAVGTVVINAVDCGRTASSTVTGTYGGEIAGHGDVILPTKVKLAGNGPWKIQIRSATTGELLATRTVACAKPQYGLQLGKTGLSNSNKVQARACNTGRAPVTAILQLAKEKKFQKVDKQVLAPGECAWLEGPKLDKGSQVKGQVLIDAPGKGDDDVVDSFTTKRPRR